MICSAKYCGKDLGGGFRKEDGTFRCAACTIHEVEINSDLRSFNEILKKCDEIINGAKYSRPSRKHIKEIRIMASAAIHVRSYDR